MPSSGENVRFQLLVNGEVKATAGIESLGVLSMILSWVRCNPNAAPKDAKSVLKHCAQELDEPDMFVRLGGLDSAKDRLMTWFVRDIQVGDEVTVRVLPPGEFDSPTV
ncbi:MAG TPA: hypothetical protein DDY78_16525 [Planctomycetales bacterium]|jgi:hypothetical protein|nr:hypothetical protein [Planctomycetales bacterium]